MRGRRAIKGGRGALRSELYWAAISAGVRGCETTLKACYHRLRARGKPAKVAIVAVMRKLVVLANTLIAENRTWMPKTS
ncbi:MAG: hypothetical protein ACR2O4_16615 [Hyphomicrobiaceae bacterium]